MFEKQRDCYNCKNVDILPGKSPCRECDNSKEQPDCWEPVEAKIATESSSVDMVNRPPHYTHGKYECIDVMVDVFGEEAVKTFCLLNTFKYEWRSKRKNGLEDIKKAWWYLDKYLQLEGKKDGE